MRKYDKAKTIAWKSEVDYTVGYLQREIVKRDEGGFYMLTEAMADPVYPEGKLYRLTSLIAQDRTDINRRLKVLTGKHREVYEQFLEFRNTKIVADIQKLSTTRIRQMLREFRRHTGLEIPESEKRVRQPK